MTTVMAIIQAPQQAGAATTVLLLACAVTAAWLLVGRNWTPRT